jgi:hypothetical protein
MGDAKSLRSDRIEHDEPAEEKEANVSAGFTAGSVTQRDYASI